MRKTGNQEAEANKPVRISTSPVVHVATKPERIESAAPVSKNNAFAGTRAKAKQQSKHATPKVSLPKVKLSTPQSYSEAKLKDYGRPLNSRQAELDRLMYMDPQV